jgi:hypothetical protein
LKIVAFIALIDLFWVIPGQIYGLVFDIVGAWILLVVGDLQGRYAIANQSARMVGCGIRDKTDRAVSRALAKRTVVSNLGLVWLTTGFLLQIAGLTMLPEGNLIGIDPLAN